MTIKRFNYNQSDKPFDTDNLIKQFYNLSEENKSTQKAIAHLRADLKEEFLELKKILVNRGINK